MKHSRHLSVSFSPLIHEMGEIPISSDPWEIPVRECMKRSAVSGRGWHSESLAVSIIIVGNRPIVNYKYDIANATLCHCAHISCLPGLSASHRMDQWGACFPSFSCSTCDQTRQEHLGPLQTWSSVNNEFWLAELEAKSDCFEKQWPWPLWWRHFLRLPPVCCGFFLSEAIPGPSRQSWGALLQHLSTCTASVLVLITVLDLFIPCLLPVPD